MSTEPVPVLDDYDVLQRVDKRNMLRLISELPEQFETAMGVSRMFTVEPLEEEPDAVVFISSGDSAVATSMAAPVLREECRVPVTNLVGGRLPRWVTERSLVVPLSYDGTSESVLRNYAEAVRRGARVVCVTSGGPLLAAATQDGVSTIKVLPGQPARTAIGYQLAPLAAILEAFGLARGVMEALSHGVKHLKNVRESLRFTVATERNIAKQTALQLEGKLVVIYGASDYRRALVRRWVNQIGANSKVPAFGEPLPIGVPSRLSGWEGIGEIAPFAAVFLTDPSDRGQQANLIKAMQSVLTDTTVVSLEMRGASTVEKSLYGIYLADFVSVYLALLRGVDPTPTDYARRIQEQVTEAEAPPVVEPPPPEPEPETETEEH